MKSFNSIRKGLLSLLLMSSLFSISFAATTQKGWDILDQLKRDGRTNDEIRQAMRDLGYNPDEYLGNQTTSRNKTSSSTTQLGRDILNKYRQDGWTDDEIKKALKDAGLDTSGYFPETKTTNYSSTTIYSNSNGNSILEYESRSCKIYRIEYISTLNAYTSPDLLKKEYFVNIDYLKRYIDSKNTQNSKCSTNEGWISYSYSDNYDGTDRYTAPNGKVYFIISQNGLYTSNELKSPKNFSTINELKNYIKERNPLISMGTTNSKNKDAIINLRNELFD